MAGQRGIDRDGGGFQIANFTNHDHVGRLAQNCPQRRRKRQPDRFIHLHLVDARQQVFYRVLHGNDFPVWPIDEVQAGIEGGGFARTRWAGY